MNNIIIRPIMKLMGSCEDITMLIEQSMDNSVGLLKKMKIKLHLLGCIYCQRYEKQAVLIRKAMESFDAYSIQESIELSSAKKDQIIQLLKNQKNN